MTGFKPQLSFNGLPRTDDFIQIWTDPDFPQTTFPHWEGSESDYVMLTGLGSQSIARLMTEVNNRGQEMTAFYRSHYPAGSWDVMIKPIAWMESVEIAIELYKMLSFLDEGEQSEILTDIQLQFNEPWGMVDMIDAEAWEELKNRYDLA